MKLLLSTPTNPTSRPNTLDGGELLPIDTPITASNLPGIVAIVDDNNQIVAQGRRDILRHLNLCARCLQPLSPCPTCNRPHRCERLK